ncbi:MAG: energy transducer TonB, partial [Acidobacteriota bacterium]
VGEGPVERGDGKETILRLAGRRHPPAQADLDAENWRSARRGATSLLDSLSRRVASAGEAENRLFAVAALHRALAHAGAGDLEKAEWDWHIAASFDKDEAAVDLSRYREAGRRLDEARRRYLEEAAQTADLSGGPVAPMGDSGAVTRPRRKATAVPSPSGRPGLGGGPVKIHAIIDVEGRVIAPRLVEYSRPSRGFEALDLIKKWRFEPATLDGKPVPVFYRLTVNF